MIFVVKPQAKATVPSDPAFAFLGAAGSPVWILPQIEGDGQGATFHFRGDSDAMIVRGLIAVLQNDCDLINMSYGGPSAFADEGRVGDLLSEVVNDHGVIFVASAAQVYFGNTGLYLAGALGGKTFSVHTAGERVVLSTSRFGAWQVPEGAALPG